MLGTQLAGVEVGVWGVDDLAAAGELTRPRAGQGRVEYKENAGVPQLQKRTVNGALKWRMQRCYLQEDSASRISKEPLIQGRS